MMNIRYSGFIIVTAALAFSVTAYSGGNMETAKKNSVAPPSHRQNASAAFDRMNRETKQEHWLFLGDSITMGGHYVDYVETWFLLNEENPPEIINLGLSSETVSGLSEPEHPFPRPCLHTRLDRVLERIKPDLVIACYGMNCGIYHPFSESRFQAYKEGIRTLINQTQTGGSDIILLTPPPYAGGIKPQAPPGPGQSYGYKRPAADYNQTLQRYADWILSLDGKNGVRAFDIRPGLEAFMEKCYPNDPIHPNPYGHKLMAEAFLQKLAKDTGSNLLQTGINLRTSDPQWISLLKLVERQRVIYEKALLNDIGHGNPDVKKRNRLTLAEAREKVISVNADMEAIVSESKFRETSTSERSLTIDTAQQWLQAVKQSKGINFKDGLAALTGKVGHFQSVIWSFKEKCSVRYIVFRQSPFWQNWEPVDNLGPTNLADAPVLLSLGPENYWIFGRYSSAAPKKGFQPQDVMLAGFDIPLKTTPFSRQFDAPGGLRKGLGGYHAWQSRDMVNWVHHGPVTEKFSRWVTTAEYADGKTYIYYDYPNDQDPHLYIDEDLTDGVPGRNRGMAFRDPSHGSDCAVIRDLDGRFHLIYEDWSPINARTHSWDSPLAGHAVSDDGISGFNILSPAVDFRTTPTGEVAEYLHPHWKQHPEWDSNVGRYNIHKPGQDAFGDWAAICIGGQYYLFGDYHPAGKSRREMRVAWFTSSSLNKEFLLCGTIGTGHPDPDIAFAEGQFYLVTQMQTDYVSPGPWVEKVEARVGVDTDKDDKIDRWTAWKEIKERYAHIPGFARQIRSIAARLDGSVLPAGYGFQIEIKLTDSTSNKSRPVLDQLYLHVDSSD